MQNLKDFFGFRLIAFIIVLLIVLGSFFRHEVYDFFFSPDGLSIATSEICIFNDSEREPVVKLSANNGATMISLLFTGEKLCAPSPMEDASGVVLVSAQDDVPPFCEKIITDERLVVLKTFNDDGTCEWDVR